MGWLGKLKKLWKLEEVKGQMIKFGRKREEGEDWHYGL